MNRRQVIAVLSALAASSVAPTATAYLRNPGGDAGGTVGPIGNFRYIYANPQLRQDFLLFLMNVFHLFPEQEFHDTLISLTQDNATDQEIYQALQQELEGIKPFLGALRYAIPALRKQKEIMAEQTAMLVDPDVAYTGHLEVGSTGRYIGILEDRFDIRGDVFLVHAKEAGFGPEDIVERGQLTRIGSHIDMGNYSTRFTEVIPARSLDMVTVFIGFHHCPIDQREDYISAVRSVMSPGGKLILRDHNCHNEDMRRMAALAHDTFNAGTDESWRFNENELRNFYSLAYIIDLLEKLGLKYDGQVYFQQGDPTLNGLMSFTRV